MYEDGSHSKSLRTATNGPEGSWCGGEGMSHWETLRRVFQPCGFVINPFSVVFFFFFSVSVFSFLLLPNSNGSPHLWPVMCWASGVRAGNKHIKSPPMLSLSNLASGRRVKVKWRRSLGRLERREGNGHNVSTHHMLGHLIYMLSPNTRESKSFWGR